MKEANAAALFALVLITACANRPSTPEASVAMSSSASVPASPPEALIVYFDSGVARLSPNVDETLDHAARLYREGNPVIMTVAGHTDSRGQQEFANVVLSARRAAVVKAALVARGIPATRLQIQAFGPSNPVTIANPDAPENRRVVITWR